jgi:hypothetical protein
MKAVHHIYHVDQLCRKSRLVWGQAGVDGL